MISLFSPQNVVEVEDTFKPGIHVKLLTSTTESATKLDTKFTEFQSIGALRSVSVEVLWGEIETSLDVFDWTFMDDIVARADALSVSRGSPFYVTFILPWREFQQAHGISRLLPSYLGGDSGTYTGDPDWNHTLYDYAYAYRQSNNPGQYGFNIKLWDSYVIERWENLCKHMGKRYDRNNTVICIRTEETASGTTAVDAVDHASIGYTLSGQEKGQVDFVRLIRKYFYHKNVSVALNFSRDNLKDNWQPILQELRINVFCPNSNYQTGLNVTGSTPGALVNYPGYDGTYMLSAGWQGDDYRSDEQTPTPNLRPSYSDMYIRCRDVLKLNEIEMLVRSTEWEGTGDADVPGQGSLQDFLKTYPAIINGGISAGLISTVPTYY